MLLVHHRQSLGGCQDAQQAQVGSSCCLEATDGRCGRMARGQHHIQHDHQALGDVFWNLEVILHRLQRIVVAVETDQAHPGRGYEGQQTIQQAHAGTQDGYQAKLLARQHGRHHGEQRGVDELHLQGQIAGHLIAQQVTQLAQQGAKVCRGGGALAQHGEFVLHQRMLDAMDGHGLHGSTPGDVLVPVGSAAVWFHRYQ